MQAEAMYVVHLLSLLRIECSRRSECQDLGKPDNRVQRCPQLVAHVGQEVALGAAGGLGLLLFLPRSEEHTSELQSLMRITYAVFCLTKQNTHRNEKHRTTKEKDRVQDTNKINTNHISPNTTNYH